MVTKNKNTRGKEGTRKKLEVDKLSLNKETIRDLTGAEQKQVGGGAKCPDPTDTCQSCFCISIKR